LGDKVVALKTSVGAFEELAVSGSFILNGIAAPREPWISMNETRQSIQAGMFFPVSSFMMREADVWPVDFDQVKSKPKAVWRSAETRRDSDKIGKHYR
jgi:hypothetical protein